MGEVDSYDISYYMVIKAYPTMLTLIVLLYTSGRRLDRREHHKGYFK